MTTTNNFPYFNFDFDAFNPLQEKVIKYYKDDVNFVVSFPTGTGKTAIAEALIGFELSKNNKALYISPYKALTYEKYSKWKEKLSGVFVDNSDYDFTAENYKTASLVCVTPEALNIKTVLNDESFLSGYSLCVIDEAHLLNSNRGKLLAALIIRLGLMGIRFVLLSSVISNVRDLALWLKECNGKRSLFFNSFVAVNRIKIRRHQKTLNTVKELLEESRYEKTIVFVHTKKEGMELIKYLSKNGIHAKFHHGGLGYGKRRQIEQEFSDMLSGCDVLVSTSTLSSGVNLE